jgi:WD40 repeat protein
VETCAALKIYAEHSDTILSLYFSSYDPNLILSGSGDQSLHIWNIEQHTQSPDQPLSMNMMEDEEETISNNGNKQKRSNKPRPNRAEREKKRAAKVK